MTHIAIEEIQDRPSLDIAFRIRHAVFCVEQRVAEAEEFDGLDGECRHYLARVDGVAVGTARVRPLDPVRAKIERVAVIKAKRRSGTGAALMSRALEDLSASGVHAVLIHAQTHAESFYTRLGFVRDGPEFHEAGIPHIRMSLML